MLEQEYRSWQEQGPHTPPLEGDPGELEKFTSRYTNQQFADLFKEVDHTR